MDLISWAQANLYLVPQLALPVMAGVLFAIGVVAHLVSEVEEDPADNEWLPPTWVNWSRSLELAERRERSSQKT